MEEDEEVDEVPETPRGISLDGEQLDQKQLLRSIVVWTPDFEFDLEYRCACFCFAGPKSELVASSLLRYRTVF